LLVEGSVLSMITPEAVLQWVISHPDV
jgi:hypothetical protein